MQDSKKALLTDVVIAVVLGLIAAVLFVTSTADYIYPGESAHLAALWNGLDVTSGESIRAFVSGLEGERISGILNNAGAKFPEFGLTAEGVERTFAINYFGPKALTEALLPHLESGSAVVNTISLTAFLSRLSEKDLRPDRSSFGQLRTYGKSKLAMLQYTRELAVRRPDLRINATDPGIVDSNMITMGRWFDPLADLLFRPICKTPSQGAIPAINAITSPATARYFSGRGSRRL